LRFQPNNNVLQSGLKGFRFGLSRETAEQMKKKTKNPQFYGEDVNKARQCLRSLATENLPVALGTSALVESLRDEILVLYGRGLKDEQIVDELKKVGVHITRFALVRDRTRRNKATVQQAGKQLSQSTMAAMIPPKRDAEARVPASVLDKTGAPPATSKLARRVSSFVPRPDTPDI